MKTEDYINNITGAERRYVDFNLVKAEVRAKDDDEKEYYVEGEAAVVNQKTTIGGWFDEIIEPGAFDDVLRSEECVLLINHDSNLVMARNNVTMELFINAAGHLAYRATFPDTEMGKHYYNAIKRGDIQKSSFAFTLAPEGYEWRWSEDPEVNDLRIIKKAHRLLDVSPVTYAAYSGTSVSARSGYEDARQEHESAKRSESNQVSLKLREKQLIINQHKL
jgi:HK97 family phage prohead protease